MTYSTYFKWAVWTPAILLPLLFIADTLLPPAIPFGGWKQFFHMFILAFGVGAYFIFAFWASRVIDRKTEREVVRLACWAPVVFIPFYAAPWFLYGVIYLVSGDLAGLRLMVEWLAYIPYLLVAGYFCSIVTIAIYLIIKRFLPKKGTIPNILMLSWTGLLASAMSLPALSAQQVYRNDVYFLNTCGVPLELSLAHDSNYDDQPRRFTLGPGERRSIANYRSAGKGVVRQISDRYSLSINTTGAVKTIDAQMLRAALARVEKVEDRAVRTWTIEDRSFCPSEASQ